MLDEKKKISDKVRGVMAEKGYTQERTAAVLGISRSSLSQRYSSKVKWGADELLALANEVGEPITRFFPESACSATVGRAS